MQTLISYHSLAGGVIEPRLWNRVDLPAYPKGAAVLENVVTLPQGGVRRRPGLEYIGELPDDARLIPFSFSTTQNYLLAFYVEAGAEKMNVYKNGVPQVTYTMPGSVVWGATPAAAKANILACNWVQSADTLFVVNENFPPFSVVRTSDVSWTAQVITLNNIPQVDFNDGGAFTADIQNVTFSGDPSFISFTGGERYRLTLEGVTTEDITWSAIQADNIDRIQAALRALPIIFPRKDLTVTAGATVQDYVITFDAGLAKDWEDLQSNDPYGSTIKITHTAGEQTGSPRTEDVWSATRGWPRTITFHDARVWIGGSKSLPQSVWASCVSEFTQDYIDFDYGTGFDDEGIGVTLDTDQVNAITGIVSGRHLQILTTGGEFYSREHPITPNNVTFERQTSFGSANIRPVTSDGATLFIQRTGRALREYLFYDAEQAYTATSLSLLASHVLTGPVEMDALIGTSNDDANYVYVVNTDGTVAVFNTLRDQEVAGWTTFSTDGDFVRVGVDDQVPYFLVKRVIDGNTVYYLERLNADCYTDSAVLYTGAHAALFTGLTHLEGETVRVKADESVLTDKTVVGGEITADRASTTSAEIGLNFNTTITTLPLNQETQAGSTLLRKNRVVRTAVHLYESLGVLVDGERLPDLAFGVGVLDSPPVPYTGVREIRGLGWGRLKQKTITQVDPVPMTILGVEFMMKVNF